MKAEIVVDKPANIDRFRSRYEAAVDTVSVRLEEVAERRASIRNEELKGQVQSQLDEAQAKLDDAQDQLQNARAQLDEGWDALDSGNKQIDENEANLAEGQSKLIASQAELMDGRDKLAEAEVKLAKAEVELSTGKTVLELSRKELDSARQALIDSWNLKEDAAENFRNALRSALGDAGNDIDWASRRKLDIDDRHASARYLYITSSYKIDLRKSLESNIRDFLDSGILSDEDMVALYMTLTGGGQ